MSPAPLKVALICPSVGQTRRGYERFITDLFGLLGPELDVTLFKGCGAGGPREKVVRHASRTGVLQRVFGDRLRWPRHVLEFTTFGLALGPHLARGDFDVVHFIDPQLGRYVHAWRRVARKRYAILFTSAFTNAGPLSGGGRHRVDHVHCLTPAALDAARACGLPPENLSMLPVGVDPGHFEATADRGELRRRHGVDPDAFVILSVTTLNRHHKRVDYLIEEVAGLDGNWLLWIDGSVHPDGDPTLLDLAATRLGDRCRHTHVPSDRVGELFRLADVMVSTSLHEAFGMSLVEAMCAGLPVLTHDTPHFRWLQGGGAAANGQPGHLADMRRPGALAACLGKLKADPAELRRFTDPQRFTRRFAWTALKAGYLEMYNKAAARVAR